MASPKIIFFIAQNMPTPYDRQCASIMPAAVCYRNIHKIKPEDEAEPCDGVEGSFIPQQYQDKPTAKEALAAFQAKPPVMKEETLVMAVKPAVTTEVKE